MKDILYFNKRVDAQWNDKQKHSRAKGKGIVLDIVYSQSIITEKWVQKSNKLRPRE